MSAEANEVIKPNGQGGAGAAAKDAETILMEDGTSVVFAGKRKMLKKTIVSDGQLTVRFDFRNGAVRLFVMPDINVSGTDIPLVLRAAGHGLEQKIGDETAAPKGEIDVDDMVVAVDEIMDRLSKGEWNATRESGGFAGTSILMKALMEASGKSQEAISAFLKGKSQQEKLAMRASDKLAPIVERLEKEKLAKAAKVDTTSLFAELDVA